MAPTCRAQEPVAVTTVSQVMSPRVVFTSHSPARVRSMAVTSVLRLISAPLSRAPFASAWVTSTGATWPSWGWKRAPTRPVEVAERPEVADLVGADQLEGDADGVSRAAVVAVFVHPLLVGGEPEVAGAMEAHRLPGLFLQLLIEVDRVLVQLADAVAHVEERQQPGRVPGGACGELGLLDQHDVGPAELRQMVEHAAADDAAADHHHPRLIPHAPALSRAARPPCGARTLSCARAFRQTCPRRHMISPPLTGRRFRSP